jgi:5-methylcytosine-specific restriction endonuclease McrA
VMPQRVEMLRPARGKTQIRKIENRPNGYRRGYCDPKHRAWRQAVLLRDAYVCRHCSRILYRKGEAHADHVIPVSQRPDLRYDTANGQTLCASCHQKKTNSETRLAKSM